MKKMLTKLLGAAAAFALCLMLLALSPANALAQEDGEAMPQDDPPASGANRPGNQGEWIRELNLSLEQVGQIRAIQRQTREEHRAVRQRLQESQRALDEAIYSDAADDAAIEARARDVAQAQAAAVRLRAITELRIRRMLTSEQLNKLRFIRRLAAEKRQQELQQRRRENASDVPAPERRGDRRQPATSLQERDQLRSQPVPRGRRAIPLRRRIP